MADEDFVPFPPTHLPCPPHHVHTHFRSLSLSGMAESQSLSRWGFTLWWQWLFSAGPCKPYHGYSLQFWCDFLAFSGVNHCPCTIILVCYVVITFHPLIHNYKTPPQYCQTHGVVTRVPVICWFGSPAPHPLVPPWTGHLADWLHSCQFLVSHLAEQTSKRLPNTRHEAWQQALLQARGCSTSRHLLCTFWA